MKMKKWTGRIAILTALLILTVAALAGCGVQTTATLTLDEKVFEVKNEAGETVIKKDEKDAAQLIAAAYSEGFDGQEALVAALRGYDMLAEGFDDTKGEYQDTGNVNLEAAKKVIEKANATLKDAGSGEVKSDEELTAILEKIDNNSVKRIVESTKTVIQDDDGLFDKVLVGIGAVINWITRWLGFGYYVIGICIFAIIVELLMIPFAIKQQKNSIKQAHLRPKEMAIRNKYKGRNDQPTMQKMQAEIQELYQRENFSPYSGCLPLLIQLPIAMMLFTIVRDPLHYVLGQGKAISEAFQIYATTARAAGGLGMSIGNENSGTIELLSRISAADLEGLNNFQFFTIGENVIDSLQGAFQNLPNFNIGPINFGLAPMNDFASWDQWFLLLVPVLTFVTYFFTSKLQRKFMYQPAINAGTDARQVACSNQMMDITMPAMSTIFTLNIPSVIGVYWMFRSWLNFAKTVIMSKAMPLPTFTEEDYKAAAKEMAGKKTVQKSEKAGAVRSLHYIDDEDFEDTRARGIARREAIEEREKREKEEKQNAIKSPFGLTPLKKDKKKTDDGADQKTEEQPSENVESKPGDNAPDKASSQDNNTDNE